MNQRPPYDPLESLNELYSAVSGEWAIDELSPVYPAMNLAAQTIEYYVWTPDRIKALRHDAGLSQVAFAAELGVSTNTLRSWEQDWYSPNPESRELLRAFESRMEKEG